VRKQECDGRSSRRDESWSGVKDNVKDGIDGSGLLLRLQEWSHCDFGNFDRPNSVFGCRE